MSSDLCVSARGVSKSYRIVHDHSASTIGERIAKKIKNPLAKPMTETFWALKDIDFDVKKGDVVGVIGRNGAGKSTLLKILSRITAPTTGEIKIYGRVGSLLEVGTGFHPELTGRENVFLNGAILGMSRREIADRFDEIVDFAGVEQFLDTPVKRYSSGMYVRLAFSVAAHLDPEVMIVDEVLAVGDADFQAKCLGKMQDVAQHGRTVFFVSHNMHSIVSLCKSALYLDAGNMVDYGPVDGIVEQYARVREVQQIDLSNAERRTGSGNIRFVAAQPTKAVFEVAEDKTFRFKVRAQQNEFRGVMGESIEFKVMANIYNERIGKVTYFESTYNGKTFQTSGELEFEMSVKDLWLRPGTYFLDLEAKIGDNLMDHVSPACRFEVSEVFPYRGAGIDLDKLQGAVLCSFEIKEI